jgi:hypothetical protein
MTVHQPQSLVLGAGGSGTVANPMGALLASFELLISGAPTGVSITFAGAMRGGTVDAAAATYSATVNGIQAVTFAKVYDYFIVTAVTLSGGTAPKVTVNPTLTDV